MKQLAFFLFLLFPILISAQTKDGLSAQMDAYMKDLFPADQPGAAALVSKDGEVIFHKAYGMADLELSVPMQTDNVFRIGSITKQFTAVAILMLAEQGKLSIQDPITKFLTDYPTQGHTITIEHLLTHTSGIKSYTNMESFFAKARKDMTPTELIDFFKEEPMEFAPGEQWNYNNSGYIILGAIIEEISQKSYEDFVVENIFKPLGMDNSYYDHYDRIIPNRAAGYSPDENGYRNADYLSMTLPYAAGSLMMTVADLNTWIQAIHSEKLISRASLDKAFMPYTLNDGTETEYGYGWSMGGIQGMPSIEHGGGIFGFVTESIYIPEEKVFATVFCNHNGGASTPATIQLASMAIGKPYHTGTILELTDKQMADYVGIYEIKPGDERTITLEDNALYSIRTEGSKTPIVAIGRDEFLYERSFTVMRFARDKSGKVIGATTFQRNGKETYAVKTDKKIKEQVEIQLPVEVLDDYVGDFELMPGFSILVSMDGEKLMAQATGQPAFQLFAESKDHFFLKEVDAQVVFNRNDKGVVHSLTLFQGGQELEGKKVD